MTFTPLRDSSILAGGVIPGQGVYSVVSALEVSGVTGTNDADHQSAFPHASEPQNAASNWGSGVAA
jgi:hypothetical protein